MTSVRTLLSSALCAVLVAGAAVAPASAEPFHAGWRTGGWHDHGWRDNRGWGGRALAFGGLGLATGALIGAAATRPAYYAGPACGRTVSTHYNARGELVKVVQQNPC